MKIGSVGMAAGEECHNFQMAKHMVDYAVLKHVQIDAGHIGGITIAKDVAEVEIRVRGERIYATPCLR